MSVKRESEAVAEGKTREQSNPPEMLEQECLRTGLFLRGLALARLSLQVCMKKSSNSSQDCQKHLVEQAELIAKELGQLKGSVMKVGQMLSIYGEQFLPPEANAVLKNLQSQAPPLEWKAIKGMLTSQLNPDCLQELEIEEKAWASASLGQVHRALINSTGERLAVKVQYPGVDRAVASDLKALRSVSTVARLLPNLPQIDAGIAEIQSMLHQELDYEFEAGQTDDFRKRLESDHRYLVPKVHRRYSSRKVLATDFIEGVRIDSVECKSMSQERRNALALAALELYFDEIFTWRSVQTDSHFGNFLVVPAQTKGGVDRLALFDFGAVRVFSESFVDRYRCMTQAALDADARVLVDVAIEMGFLFAKDSEKLKREFYEFCVLVVEPFSADRPYDWEKSDLFTRLKDQLGKVIEAHEFRPPPREMIFLDRKTSGLFMLMSTLGACVNGRPALDARLRP